MSHLVHNNFPCVTYPNHGNPQLGWCSERCTIVHASLHDTVFEQAAGYVRNKKLGSYEIANKYVMLGTSRAGASKSRGVGL